jgi:hypothetical protein
MVRPSTVSRVMQELERMHSGGESTPLENPQCHEFGHVIGEIAGSKYPNETSRLVSACATTCGYGCAHGVVVGKLRKNPAIIQTINEICAPKKGALRRSDFIACTHGVGHALSEYASYDVEKTVRYCDRFSSQEAKSICVTGAFMEIYEAPTKTHDVLALPETPHTVCGSLPLFAMRVCYSAFAAEAYTRTRSVEQGVNACLLAPEDIKNDCMTALGSQIYFHDHGAGKTMIDTCRLNKSYVNKCIQGLLISSMVIDQTGFEGQSLCATLQGNERESCFVSLQKTYDEMNGSVL